MKPELPSIRPYLPPSATTGDSFSYDPLPPSRMDPNATFYDDAYLSPLYSDGSSTRRRRGPPGAGGAGGIPAAALEQLRALFGMNPEGAGGAPMDPELRADLLAQLQDMARAGRGEGDLLPGGFPREEEDSDEEGEEREEGRDADGLGVLGRLVQYMRGAQPPPEPQG